MPYAIELLPGAHGKNPGYRSIFQCGCSVVQVVEWEMRRELIGPTCEDQCKVRALRSNYCSSGGVQHDAKGKDREEISLDRKRLKQGPRIKL